MVGWEDLQPIFAKLADQRRTFIDEWRKAANANRVRRANDPPTYGKPESEWFKDLDATVEELEKLLKSRLPARPPG
jgi:hypothetical protein